MIPPHANKVFSGIFFDVYRWDQQLYDGRITPFEMLMRRPTVDIIATVGERILLLEQEQPGVPRYPCLPGGMLELDEQPETAARRELLEETGYSPITLALMREFTHANKVMTRDFVFLARDCSKVADATTDGGEQLTIQLATFDEFLDAVRHERFHTSPGLRRMVYEALLDAQKKSALREEIFG